LHERPELALAGIKGTLLPGGAIIARPVCDGEMTTLVCLHKNFVVFDHDTGMKEGREGIPKMMKLTNNIPSRLNEYNYM
jgi:hypothetical protein